MFFTSLLNHSPKNFVHVLHHTIGIGPADMEPGDIVVSVPAAVTPYILRPASWRCSVSSLAAIAKEMANHEYYSVVGHCYIDSFALGEAPPLV